MSMTTPPSGPMDPVKPVVHGVDMSIMRWFDEQFPHPRPESEMLAPRRTWRSVFIHLVVAMAIVGFLELVRQGAGANHPSALAMGWPSIFWAGFFGLFALIRPRRRILGVFSVLLVGLFTLVWMLSFFYVLNGIAVVMIYASFLASTTRPTRNKKAVPWDPNAPRVFGVPGQVGSASAKFGVNAQIGAEGECKTADLFQYLARIPGVMIYHGLRFPGSKNADVDHAVVYGNNVWLIDSKQYRGGDYTLAATPDGGIEIASSERQYRTHMDSAVKSFQRMMPAGVQVGCVIAVHGNGVRIPPGVGFAVLERSRQERQQRQCNIELMDPQQMLYILGERIAESARVAPASPRYDVLHVLNQHLITA